LMFGCCSCMVRHKPSHESDGAVSGFSLAASIAGVHTSDVRSSPPETMESDLLFTYIKRNCPKLKDLLDGLTPESAEPLLLEIGDTPNPRATSGRIDDLLAADSCQAVQQVLADSRIRVPFLATLAGSRFLSAILLRNPALMVTLFLREGYLVRKTRTEKETELQGQTQRLELTPDLDRVVRLYKETEYLRLGVRDLGGLADVQEIMGELSSLAGACTEAAVDFHWRRLKAKHGLPPVPPNEKGFVVLGMGKVSGGELNFSSDLDLIFLRGPEEGRTAGREPVTVVRFYETLARAVTKSLSEVTEDGFVLRVDLRLRPEGDKGELVPSVSNALDYYLGWGRTWERAVLMKAAPLAGDLDLGKDFLKELEPFIYRKHLDYSTLEDMRIMKGQIEAHLRRKPGINIKLGQGGIREIEFFVQALQLINGGRTPRIRSTSTLDGLNLLHEAGLVDKDTVADLRQAYLFFRKTEHRIQINHQLQTHELPRTTEEQEELARRMGYGQNALQCFLTDLESHRKVVEELFSSLFRPAGDEPTELISPRVGKMLQVIEHETAAVELLAELGFQEPEASYPLVKNLLSPSDRRIDSEKGRLLLARVAPLFLDELLNAPEPGRALAALDHYIDSLHSASGYFSTFLENPATVRFLINMFGESRFFTDLLIRHPQSIDSLISRGSHERPREGDDLESELAQRLIYCEDFEDELEVLRRFKHEEILRIGVSQFAGDIDSPTGRWLVTELAEVCLSAAVDIATREMGRKFGFADKDTPPPLVILGMGKLGGMEMTYLSDLDVIFIYDSPEQQIGRFSAHEWFTRLASRIISILTVPTADGTVFEIDTRLRPSGNKGPLVSSMESFREYHRSASHLWEKQALIRARPVVGPAALREEVTNIVRESVVRTAFSDEVLAEIARLRKRMERELALEDAQHADLKTGRGGLVDVEFFVQANVLKYAREYPAVLCNNTLEALAALRRESLISEDSFQTLDSGYRFLSNLEDRLRIMEHRSVDRLPLSGEKLRGLARRLGYGGNGENDGELLVSDYRRVTKGIRKVYSAFFGVERYAT
jgi:[glutamine synthetase] adenylyltransferase / [glutamine synthetase]-adenylyl-L-tyrosine phosphorylase